MLFGSTTLAHVHVLISLIGILSGVVVLAGLLSGKRLDRWTATFLASTVLTSVTGYFFPVHKLMPSHVIGGISLIALAVAIVARYSKQTTGAWRKIYVAFAMIALYLNVFVLIFQLFTKVPALLALAPTQSEAPFLVTQVVIMLTFIVLTIFAVKRFPGGPAYA